MSHKAFNISLSFFLFSIALFPHFLGAQLIKVRIYPDAAMRTCKYQAMGQEVVVFTNDPFPFEIARLKVNELIEMQTASGDVKVIHNGNVLGEFTSVTFWCNDPAPRFKVSTGEGSEKKFTYPDHLVVETRGNALSLTNQVHIENYIPGVVEAEGGALKSMEFYKVQAISARTYAMKNLQRHGKDDYNLCDNTHCQVFKGIPVGSDMLDGAIDATNGQVIVHKSGTLIEAVFSANCGGYTANSEDVWVSELDYLRSVPDYDFCAGFKNHAWHTLVPKREFLKHIGDYLKVEAKSFEIEPDVSGRVKLAIVNGDNQHQISGEELRRLFQLKSSRFHIYESGADLFIEGAGYGHGVGLCQDGAYYLSQNGWDYYEIIKHYYQEVEIKKLAELELFK